MRILIWILISTFVISLVSFAGVFSLRLKKKLFDKILLSLVALSAGALMGGALLHLMPEALETLPVNIVMLYVLFGFILFFLIEKIVHWRHCHNGKCDVHSFVYMNLFGDGVHNFIDGLVIAASFLIDFNLGIVTSIAIILHEIPQEIGDFAVLIYGGLKAKKALFYNFITAIIAMIGGIVGYYLAQFNQSFMTILVPFAAGGFIYIAASDLIPELRKEVSNKAIIHFSVFILGIILMYGITFLEAV